jgi:hypothetical protein
MGLLQRVIERWRQISGEIVGQHAQERTADDVDDLVDRGISKETAEELFTFGKLLFANNDDRIKTIEAKASSILGYSSAILAFLLTRSADLDRSRPTAICVALIAACAVSACVCGWLALKSRSWKALGESTWFPPKNFRERLDEPDDLKRWYIKAMHQMYQENHRITDKKARLMIGAQLSIGVAGLLLGVALAFNSIGALFHPIRYVSFESRPSLYSGPVPCRMAPYPACYAGSGSFAQCSAIAADWSGQQEEQPVWFPVPAAYFPVQYHHPPPRHLVRRLA